MIDTPLDDLELTVRAHNVLEYMGVQTLGDITKLSETDLLNRPQFGPKSLYDVKNMLDSFGLALSAGEHVEHHKRLHGCKPADRDMARHET